MDQVNKVFGVRIQKISARDARVVPATFGRVWSSSPSAMATTSGRKQPLKTASSNAKKRKSNAGNDDKGHPPKQPKIDAFFTPRVSLSTTCGTDKTTSVAKLSEEQHGVLQLVVQEDKSVFFTGSAGEYHRAGESRNTTDPGTNTGTGKSLLLRAIISALRRKHANRPDYIAVTASTGMAASNIGGKRGDIVVVLCLVIHKRIFRNDSSFMGCSNAWERRR